MPPRGRRCAPSRCGSCWPPSRRHWCWPCCGLLFEGEQRLAASVLQERLFDALADYADGDLQRLADLLQGVAAQPASGLYLRQLPVPGLHTNWVGRWPNWPRCAGSRAWSLVVESLDRAAWPCQRCPARWRS